MNHMNQDSYKHNIDINNIVGVENGHTIVKLKRCIEVDAHEDWVEVDYIAIDNPYLETLLTSGKIGFQDSKEMGWSSVKVHQNLGSEFNSKLIKCTVASCELCM